MAAPTYAHDLVLIDDCIDDTGWSESSHGDYDDGGGPVIDTDNFIEGAVCISQAMTKTTICSLLYDNGAGITVPTDGAILTWQYYGAPTAIATKALGGFMVLIGHTDADFDVWYTGGIDFGKYPYGGWFNSAVDPTVTPDTTVGTPTSLQFIGSAVNATAAISKGTPHSVDILRYGRCEARFTDGDLGNGYCTFAGFAALNDASTARWGLLQAIDGGYLWKGLMTLGYGTAVDFRDSNASILIDNTTKAGPNFSKIEVRQAGSRVDWTNISFTALGTTSKGLFEMIDNADVNILNCQFVDMSTFIFMSNASVLTTIFRRCAQITAPGCNMSGSQVLEPTVVADASAVVWDVATDPDGSLDDMTFSKGALAHHALELGTTSPTNVTLRGVTMSGFNASNGQNDSAIYVARDTGDVTINVVGGTGNFSYKTAGANVTIVVDPVTVEFTVKDITTSTEIAGARVLVAVADGVNFPFEDSVTLVRSVSTATVTHAGHGMVTGDEVLIQGAEQWEYNGARTITYIDVNSYSYPVVGTPVTPATGTIICTMVLIDEDTDTGGTASDTRSYSNDQPFVGVIREGDVGPYKASPVQGTIDKSAGYSTIVQLIPDS